MLIFMLACACAAQTIDGVEWVAPPAGGNALRDIIFVPDGTGWAVGDRGAILRSTDGGTRWELCSSGTTDDLRAIAFSSAENGWIVGDNGTLLVTVTGGTTWERRDLQMVNQLNDIAFINPEVGMIVGDLGLILQTTDRGETWMTLKRTDPIDRTHLVLNSRGDGFICNRDGSLMLVTRFGQVLVTGKDFDKGIADAVPMRKGGGLLVLDGQNTLERTVEGRTWDEARLPDLGDLLPGMYRHIAAVNDQRYAVGDRSGALHVTMNGGLTWTTRRPFATGVVMNALVFRDDSTFFAAGSDGIIAKVQLPGCTVQLLNTLTPARIRRLYFLDEEQGLALTQELKLLNSRDGGRTWTWRVDDASVNAVGIRSIVASSDMIVHVLTDISLLSTTDDGVSWRERCVVAKICPSVQGRTLAGDMWYGGRGYLVITHAAGGRDQAFLSPRLKDFPLDEAVRGMIVEWSLPFDDDVRTFIMSSPRVWVVTTANGSMFITRNAGKDWDGFGRPKASPDFVVAFTEGVMLWLSRDGKASVGSVGENMRTAAWEQAERAACQFVDTFSTQQVEAGVGSGQRAAIRLVPPVGGISSTKGGGTIISCGNGTAWRSMDQGLHWERLALPTDENVAGIQFADAFDGWAWVRSGRVFHTGDGGKTWEMSRSAATARVMNFPSPDQGWMGTPQGYLMRTSDAGKTWSIVPLGVSMGVRDLCADVGGSVWVGFPRGVMKVKSGEMGSHSIIPIPEGDEIRLMGSMGDSSLIMYTDRGNICTLRPGDSVCRRIAIPVPSRSVSAIGGPNWQTPMVFTAENTHYRWDHGTQRWKAFSTSSPAKLNALLFVNSNTGCAAGDAGYIMVTRDGGSTWARGPRSTFANCRALTYSPLRNVLWASGDDGTVLVTDAACRRWMSLRIPCTDPFVGLQFLPPDLLYVYSPRGKIIRVHTADVLTEEE